MLLNYYQPLGGSYPQQSIPCSSPLPPPLSTLETLAVPNEKLSHLSQQGTSHSAHSKWLQFSSRIRCGLVEFPQTCFQKHACLPLKRSPSSLKYQQATRFSTLSLTVFYLAQMTSNAISSLWISGFPPRREAFWSYRQQCLGSGIL